MTKRSRTRAHWWQTPSGHIPYINRVGLALGFGLMFVAAGWRSLGPWALFLSLAMMPLVGVGIWMEWDEGY